MTIESAAPTIKKQYTNCDDHPLLYKGIRTQLQDTTKNHEFSIMEAKDCESAYNLITDPESVF
jgi:hypothetical protein